MKCALVALTMTALTMPVCAAPPTGAVYHPLKATVEPPFPNPLKGLIPFYDAEPVAFPHSMEWLYWQLSDVVIGVDSAGNNIYDWNRFDAALDAVAKRGHQACVRFYTYYPDDPKPKNAMPAFLQPATTTWVDGTTKREVPNFNDPQVVRCLTQFIGALGNRYDHPTPNPRIGFITAGLVGFWGEWHVYTGNPGWNESAILSEGTKGQIARVYQDHFQNIPVLLRYPLSDEEQKQGAVLKRFGYHDDSFAFATAGTPDWYFANRMGRAGLSDLWRTKPIGGEIYPETQDDVFRTGSENYKKWNASVVATHPTWMIAARVLRDNADSKSTEFANARKETARLGYNIQVSGAYFPPTSTLKQPLYVGVSFVNTGIAPFYYPWKMQIGLRNTKTGNVTAWNTGWDIRNVLPGEKARLFEFTRATLPANSLPTGTYDVVLQLLHPLKQQYPATLSFRFANGEQQKDGWLTLGSLQIIR